MTQVISTSVPHEQQNSQLLPTFPQHLVSGLTSHELRAALAGQRHYQSHQHGTYATHEELCAFLKRKQQQWEYAHTSVEWQINFIGGWHAALLADPTAEKKRPGPEDHGGAGGDTPIKTRPIYGQEDTEERRVPRQGEPDSPLVATARILCDPEGGEDEEEEGFLTASRPFFAPDDETEEHHQTKRAGEPLDAPIKAGEPTAPITARPSFEPEDDEDLGWSIKCSEERDEGGDWGHHPIKGSVTRLLFAPEGDDGTSWTLIKCSAARSVFGPNGGDEPGWWIAALHDGDDDTWGRAPIPLFGPEDDRGGGWSIIKCGEADAPITAHSVTSLCYAMKAAALQYLALCRTHPVWPDERDIDEDHHSLQIRFFDPSDECDGEWNALVKCQAGYRPLLIDEDDGDSKGHRPLFDGEEEEDGGYRPRQRGGATLLACPSFIDEEDEDRCPSFGGEDTEDNGWGRSPRKQYGGATLLARPSFIDDDDEDRCPPYDDEKGGWLCSRLPRYLKTRGGVSLLTMPSVPSVFSLPISISMSLGGDGRRPLFDDEKPDDDGWHHPRLRSLAQQRSEYPLMFGEDAEDDGHWGRSAVASLCGGAAWTI